MSGGHQMPNIQENSQDMINDIQSLQTMERQLFNSLETNPNLSSEQKAQIIEKIGQLSTMRINLYQTMGGVNTFFQSALSSSQGTLQEQTSAIQIIEEELNQAKSQLADLQEEKINKLRLVEINNYFGEKYAEHADLMKILIFTLVPIIILAVLYSKQILPKTAYYILIAIVALIGAIFFVKRFISIISRNNMDYQSYDFYFDPSGAVKTVTDGTDASNNDDPWKVAAVSSTCVGSACCATGVNWDASNNQCDTGGVGSGGGVGSRGGVGNRESFMTESMVNSILTRDSTTNKYKQGFTSSYNPSMSDSFINSKV
jgi:hypothetical protein